MVPHTWQSPSSSPPQRSLTSQQPPISLLFTNLVFNPQPSPLSEESFPHLIPPPSHFRFSRGCLFHTTLAHTASSFSFRWNPTPWRNNHLRRLVILRHTSPPMLATLWNKRHVTHPRRWERHSETKDKVVSTRDDDWCSCFSFLTISINFKSSFCCEWSLHDNNKSHKKIVDMSPQWLIGQISLLSIATCVSVLSTTQHCCQRHSTSYLPPRFYVDCHLSIIIALRFCHVGGRRCHSVRLSWRSQSIFLKFLLWMITPW